MNVEKIQVATIGWEWSEETVQQEMLQGVKECNERKK